MALRWGILGASKIARDFVLAMKTLPVGENQVVAIASSSEARAKSFAEANNVGKWYGSYDELLKDPEVQVVYIAGLTNTHADSCKLALNNGKSVLCEKAFAMSAREAKEVLAMAKEKKLFLMEAMWTRFVPSFCHVQRKLDEGAIGDVKVVQVNFGIAMEHVPRVSDPKMGGSVILDIGVYVLTVADMAFGGERPEKIQVSGFNFDTGVDQTANISLLYSNKRMAQLIATAGVQLENTASFFGTKGFMRLDVPFHCSTRVSGSLGVKDFSLPDTEEPTNCINSSGFRYQIDAVRRSILAGELENKLMPHSTTIRIMEYMDEIRRQLGARLE